MKGISTTTASLTIRTKSVEQFLSEIRKYEVLPESEIVALVAEAQAGSIEAENKIINHNLRFIFSLCKRYAKGNDVLDLVSVATIGMKRSITTFDETKGFKFISYAVGQMRFEIISYFKRENPIVYQTNSAILGNKTAKITNDYLQTQMRMPSEEELIEELENEFGIVLKNRHDVVTPKINSINEFVSSEEEGTAEEIGEFAMASASTNEFVETEEAEYRKRVVAIFLSGLKQRDAEIIKMSFGLDEWEGNEQTDEQISQKLGMTRERIRQIKETQISKMRMRKNRVMALA